MTVNADGAFTFPTALGAGENYSVSILTQPSNPQQVCILNNAVGTANANVTSIQVMCTTVAPAIISGPGWAATGPANYGTLGQPATSNLPPVRSYAASWTDASGNVWLFGGNNGYLGNQTNIIGPCGPTPTTYFDYNDLEVLRRPMGVDGWLAVDNIQAGRRLWRPRTARIHQFPRRAPRHRHVDRRLRQFLALRRFWVRLNHNHLPGQPYARRLSERPMEVRKRPMDMDGRLQPRQPIRYVWHTGRAKRNQYPGPAPARHGVDRPNRHLLALRWSNKRRLQRFVEVRQRSVDLGLPARTPQIRREFTASSVCPLSPMRPERALPPWAGPTHPATSGSLVAMASTPRAPPDLSTISGAFLPANGLGSAVQSFWETPIPTALSMFRLPPIFRPRATALPLGAGATAVSGCLAGVSTICGNTSPECLLAFDLRNRP